MANELFLVIPEHTDAEGISRSLVLYGGDDEPGHFRAALVPPQGDPLRVMERILAPGWEAYALPHPGIDFNEVSGVTFLGLDVLRDGIRLSVLRCFPLGEDAADKDLSAIVRDAAETVRLLLAGGGTS